MRTSPAEPLSYGAAESAFKLNEVSAMFVTLCFTESHCLHCTLATHKLLRFVVARPLSAFAVFHSTKVRVFAFEALIERQLKQCKFFQLVEVDIRWISQSFILINAFCLSSFNSFLFDFFFDFLSVSQLNC